MKVTVKMYMENGRIVLRGLSKIGNVYYESSTGMIAFTEQELEEAREILRKEALKPQ